MAPDGTAAPVLAVVRHLMAPMDTKALLETFGPRCTLQDLHELLLP